MDIATIVSWIQVVIWAYGIGILVVRILQSGKASMPKWAQSNRALMIVFVSGLLLSSLSLYLEYTKTRPIPYSEWQEYRKPLEEVRNQMFAQERIELDGKHFIGCKFLNVTLVYRGERPFTIDGAIFSGTTVIEIQDGPQAGAAMAMQMILDACKKGGTACPDWSTAYFVAVLPPDKLPKLH